MELLTAKKAITHGGRVRERGETFEVKDRTDSKGIVVESSAKAEAERMVAEGYAEAASATDIKRFKTLNEKPAENWREAGLQSDPNAAPVTVSMNSPAPPPPAPVGATALADDEEEVEEKNDATGEVKKIRRKKGGR